jgi:hypothetical protein
MVTFSMANLRRTAGPWLGLDHSMRQNARHTVAAIASLAAAFVLIAAAPAMAALPPTDDIEIIGWAGSQLLSVDPDTAQTTTIGAVGPTAITGLDIHGNGLGYAVTFGASQLYAIDQTVPSATLIGAVALADATPVTGCTALDYPGTGPITASCDGPNPATGTIDPATGTFTPVITNSARLADLATDPTSGKLYGFGYDSSVYVVDLAAATLTQVANISVIGFGADFDSAGTLWLSDQRNLYSVDTATWTKTLIGAFGNTTDFFENLTVMSTAPVVVPPVVPAAAPQLAATGVESLPPLGLALTMLIAGGGAFVASRHRRTA